MLYTVSDFFRTYERSLRTVAGSSGFSRAVSSVGILDYELVPGLGDRYRQRNFDENMVVLTTFLYAQNDPYLIVDAVKYLVAQGASALVIKNVLHLSIPDQALRYADARDFPVFVVTADGWFFDHVIYSVDKHIDDLASFDYVQSELDALLEDGSPEGSAARARRLNPSFCDALQVMRVEFDEPLMPSSAAAIEVAYRKSVIVQASNMFAFHDGGIVFVDTADSMSDLDVSACEVSLREIVVRSGVRVRIAGVGVSEPLFGLEQLGRAIRQASAACALSMQRGESQVRFADLGILRAVVPFAHEPALRAFSAQVLNPLREFDVEHAAQLEATLQTYMDCGRSVDTAAHELGQHANTVRYRLDKVRTLTGLDYRQPDQAEQLSLACAIDAASKLR